jgi:hypothetical protein
MCSVMVLAVNGHYLPKQYKTFVPCNGHAFCHSEIGNKIFYIMHKMLAFKSLGLFKDLQKLGVPRRIYSNSSVILIKFHTASPRLEQ